MEMKYFDLDKLKAEESIYPLYERYLKDFGKEEGIYDKHIEKAYIKEYKQIMQTEAYIKEYREHIDKYGCYYSHVLGFDTSYEAYLDIAENSHGIRDTMKDKLINLSMSDLFSQYTSLGFILNPLIQSGKEKLAVFCDEYINWLKKAQIHILGLLINFGYTSDFKVGDYIYSKADDKFTNHAIYRMSAKKIYFKSEGEVVKSSSGKTDAAYNKSDIYVKRKLFNIKVVTNNIKDIILLEEQKKALAEYISNSKEEKYNRFKKQLNENTQLF
jgi:hypothetical protein